jgi:6-pyruvoyltetrahydropterin/6-carboxytetrahydropterin synthase
VFRVTRRYRFAASHRLHAASLTEAENWRVYGKCNNPYGHGHNYVLHVSALGPAEGASGQAVHIGLLDELVEREVIRKLDHRNLNQDIDWFELAVPTSENLGMAICQRLQRSWKSVFPGEWPKLDRVCIEETPRNIFEVGADEIE